MTFCPINLKQRKIVGFGLVAEIIHTKELSLSVHLWIYLLTPWNRALLGKITGSQLVKKVPAFYETRRFTTAFTCPRHLSLSCARSIQSMPPFPLTEDPSYYYLSIYARVLPVVSFPQFPPLEHFIHFFSPS